jgi:hypothetical protein
MIFLTFWGKLSSFFEETRQIYWKSNGHDVYIFAESRVKNTRQICYHPNCVTDGYGCVGQYGPCAGICYCIGVRSSFCIH